MKKVINIVKVTIINVAFCVLAYYAVLENVAGAKNALLFIIYGMLLFTALSLIPEVITKAAETIAEPIIRTLPNSAHYIIDFSLTMFFIWNGWWVTGIAYGVMSLLLNLVFATLRDLSQKNLLNKISQ